MNYLYLIPWTNRQKAAAAANAATPLHKQRGGLLYAIPIDRSKHTMAFDKPVMDHWYSWESETSLFF